MSIIQLSRCFRIKEACILLNVSTGSAILLEEALNNSDEDASVEILTDVGVRVMSVELALKVIATRTDVIRI